MVRLNDDADAAASISFFDVAAGDSLLGVIGVFRSGAHIIRGVWLCVAVSRR